MTTLPVGAASCASASRPGGRKLYSDSVTVVPSASATSSCSAALRYAGATVVTVSTVPVLTPRDRPLTVTGRSSASGVTHTCPAATSSTPACMMTNCPDASMASPSRSALSCAARTSAGLGKAPPASIAAATSSTCCGMAPSNVRPKVASL